METKAEKFIRLSTDRVNIAVFKIEQLGKLATRQYESTDTQRADIVDTLDAALDGLRKIWKVPSKQTYLGTTPPPMPKQDPVPMPDPPWNPSGVQEARVVTAPANPPRPGAVAPVDGRDRIAIRQALLTLVQTHGPNDPGVAALRSVVVGWAVGEGSPEELAAREDQA